MTLDIAGNLLTASVDDRTLTYRLLPYGEAGSTNLGKVTASAGSVQIPDDVSSVTLNIEHDFKRPVGRATRIDETDQGLEATFKVATTTAGNDLLAEAAEGLRPAVSVEIDNPVIRAGALVGGLLTAAGAVVRPAFPSAQLVAEDYGETVTTDSTVVTETNDGATITETRHTETTIEINEPSDEDNDKESEATVPNENIEATATAPVGLTATNVNQPKIENAEALFAQLAKAHSTGNTMMLAALDQAVQADVQAAQPAQYVGEIWATRSHRQKFLPLFSKAPLTSLKVTGWEFDRDVDGNRLVPTTGSYAGFPAQPTSTESKTKSVEINAQREAGANGIDRAFVDFSTPEFWAGFYRESANSLSKNLDARGEAHMFTAANYKEVEGGTVPTDVATALAYIVDGVLAVQDVATPDFAVVGTDLYRALALTKSSDALEYLNVALGLDPAEGRLDQFKIVPSSNASVLGKVLVGCSEAHTYYGEKQVRVDTVNIGTGGIETGVFAYYALHTKDKDAFALVGAAV